MCRIIRQVPFRAFTRHNGEILRYGNSFPPTFPEVLLAHASLTDWPIVAKHANMTSSRGSINAEPATITSESFPSTDSCKRTSYSRICMGPIENPPDNHDHCIACLGLAHAEAALEESDCTQCADLPLRVLRTRRNVARGLFGVRPTAPNVPLVGPKIVVPTLEGGDDNLARSHRSQRSPQSPVTFSDGCFRPPLSVVDFVSFGQEAEEDSISISASEKEEWVGSDRDRSDSEGASDLQEELVRVMNKAVQELELSWNPPEEPTKSKLDSWYFRFSRRQVDTRTSVPFFSRRPRLAR